VVAEREVDSTSLAQQSAGCTVSSDSSNAALPPGTCSVFRRVGQFSTALFLGTNARTPCRRHIKNAKTNASGHNQRIGTNALSLSTPCVRHIKNAKTNTIGKTTPATSHQTYVLDGQWTMYHKFVSMHHQGHSNDTSTAQTSESSDKTFLLTSEPRTQWTML